MTTCYHFILFREFVYKQLKYPFVKPYKSWWTQLKKVGTNYMSGYSKLLGLFYGLIV